MSILVKDVGFQGISLYGWFISNNVFVRVAFLCECLEVGDLKWGVYVFFVFCLGVVEVGVVCLGDLLFVDGVVIFCD